LKPFLEQQIKNKETSQQQFSEITSEFNQCATNFAINWRSQIENKHYI
jgi:hypothetical protein